MNLGKYIHHLLLENETVIIPGFGAFISNYKPAEISENEIKPPTKEISFTHQIRNNDGLLVGYISSNEKISHFDALKAIEKERENITYLLDKGEKFNLEQTGTLFYNQKGEIEFEPLIDDNLLLDSFGLDPITIHQTSDEEPIEPDIIEDSSLLEKAEIVQEPGEKLEETVLLVEAEKENESQIEEDHEDLKLSEETKEQEPSVEVKSEPVPETKNFHSRNEPEERKKRSGLWYLLILIPIIVSGIFVLRNQNKSKNPEDIISQKNGIEIEEIPAQQNNLIQQDSTALEISGPVETDEVMAMDSIKENIPITENTKIEGSESTVFYLIGGSFKEEENAENYLIELKGKGFEPFHLGKRGNFYIIGIGRYNTESEAVRAKREFSEQNSGSGAWIMEE